jgi:hypothetical protein
MKEDEVEQIARAARLSSLDGRSFEQLAKSIEKGRFHTNQLPQDLSWNEEAACIFRPNRATGEEQ